MMEQVFVNLAWQLSTSSLSHLSKVEVDFFLPKVTLRHVLTQVTSIILTSVICLVFFIVYIYWSSDHSEIPDS